MATNPEALLISAIVRSANHLPVITANLDTEMFTGYQEEWKWLTEYVTRHRRTPSKKALRAEFPSFTIYAVDDIDHYVEEVKKEYTRQQLINGIDTVASLLQAGENPYKVLEQARSFNQMITMKVEDGITSETDIIAGWKDIYNDAIRRVVRTHEKGTPGIPTGFETLDLATGGIQPGHLWILSARLGVGKTWGAVKIATNALVAGYKPLYFSLEQSRAAIGYRAHTFLSAHFSRGKNTFKNLDLNKGENYSLLEYKRFLRGLTKKVRGGFFVNDTTRGRVSTHHIAAQIEMIQPDLVIIDYLTLLARESSDWQAVAKLIGDIKSIAEKYQVPILVISQINRTGVGKEPPGTEALAQSDSVGQDADAVVSMARYSDHVMKFKLAKFRHGPDGHIWFAEFDVNNGLYREISGDEAARIKQLDTEHV